MNTALSSAPFVEANWHSLKLLNDYGSSVNSRMKFDILEVSNYHNKISSYADINHIYLISSIIIRRKSSY